MKYLKKFEDASVIEVYPDNAKVGDIVVCIKVPTVHVSGQEDLQYGEKYEIITVHSPLHFNLKNIKTGRITNGWSSRFFKYEMDADTYKNMIKYNLL